MPNKNSAQFFGPFKRKAQSGLIQGSMLGAVGCLQIAEPFRMAHVSATRRGANVGCRSTPLARARWHPGRFPIAPDDSREAMNRRDRRDH